MLVYVDEFMRMILVFATGTPAPGFETKQHVLLAYIQYIPRPWCMMRFSFWIFYSGVVFEWHPAGEVTGIFYAEEASEELKVHTDHEAM